MLAVNFASRSRGIKILCLGAHCDDIEIGCGGTIMRLAKEYKIQHLKWVVFSSSEERANEAQRSAEVFASDCKEKEIIVKTFRDGFLPYHAEIVKNFFEELKSFNPDIVFTHCRQDMHQDHRLICELTWNTFRNHQILEYEIPKYDGDLGTPNFYVTLEREVVEQKVETIMECFRSQIGKHWFDKETFFGLMRIRGIESASPTKFAEGFYFRKCVM